MTGQGLPPSYLHISPGRDPVEHCRSLLTDEHFEWLQCEVETLPADIDRAAVFDVIRQRAFQLSFYSALGDRMWQRLDEAAATLGRAIAHFKEELRSSSGLDEKDIEHHIGGLEREYERISRNYSMSEPLLVKYAIVSSAGGRPGGAREAQDALRTLGVSRDAARGLLEAAGLSEATPGE